MTGRKCSTCKHYDPAPILGKGWCRNPLLYSPQQSHLVFEGDLDCERGMGNYWEPAQPHSPITLTPIIEQTLEPANSGGPEVIGYGHLRVYPVTGSSGYRDDPSLDDIDDDRRVGQGGDSRQIDYYTEERYWTDYLRIILPILGVLIFLILLYLWALAFLRGDDQTPGQATGDPTSTIAMITAEATATQAAGATGTPSNPGIVLTPAPIDTPGPGTTPIPTQTTPEEPSGEIFVGALVRVANTGGTGANLRGLPTTDSDVITVHLDGTELDVIGGPEEAQGFVWWNVSNADGEGWIVADYLEVVE